MVEDPRLARLPDAMAVALRLKSTGCADQVVATALDIPVESVPVLVRIAHAKLERLGDESAGT